MYLTNSQLNVKDNGKRSPVESESCIEFMILSLLLIFFEVYDLLPAYNFHATYFRIPSRWVIDLHSMTILKVNSRKIKFFLNRQLQNAWNSQCSDTAPQRLPQLTEHCTIFQGYASISRYPGDFHHQEDKILLRDRLRRKTETDKEIASLPMRCY